MLTPSFSLNAFCDHDASVETPYSVAPCAAKSSSASS